MKIVLRRLKFWLCSMNKAPVRSARASQSFMLPIPVALITGTSSIHQHPTSWGTICLIRKNNFYTNLRGQEVTKEHFCKGPYCYTRHPTHWGLFLLILGFGFVVNGFFIILSAIAMHLLAKVTFIKKYEYAMLRHFGAPYEEYKKSVKI